MKCPKCKTEITIPPEEAAKLLGSSGGRKSVRSINDDQQAALQAGKRKWSVTADHPIFARPDKFGMLKSEARAYADSLRPLGYENINITRQD